MSTVNIAGLDKADLLMRAFNASHQLGLGQGDPEGRQDMTKERAGELISQGYQVFDYVHGRVLKIDISGDEVRTYAYNRDVGPGVLEKIVDDMRSGALVPPPKLDREPLQFDAEKFARENPIEIRPLWN
jgi:hypothetical protein